MRIVTDTMFFEYKRAMAAARADCRMLCGYSSFESLHIFILSSPHDCRRGRVPMRGYARGRGEGSRRPAATATLVGAILTVTLASVPFFAASVLASARIFASLICSAGGFPPLRLCPGRRCMHEQLSVAGAQRHKQWHLRRCADNARRPRRLAPHRRDL